MSYLLQTLRTKREVDEAIRNTDDLLLVLRFGREDDATCLQLDEILSKTERHLSKMAVIRLVDVDAVPEYVQYFDITLIPATVFFFNAQHMKCDYGTPDHTKWIGAFHSKQDFIDLVEVLYRTALHGKFIAARCPIDPKHIPKYTLIYNDI
ncbi:catalytic, putative [Acanthamoeba castellanii str. Neff]|uniref:Thioredoxin-like protein 4B n=1 Tax=Acanthamoeba castellanii (strain ATCC 30010 / Neff) TaxID=1257118 RepID=L8GQ61_ACACF|nr:catalytic, putative [Acanthamoeba castellanii str. Neff]ELR14793.1 catalytic, putative [Acanthamoeba castellanii str. Neff]